MEIKFHLFDVTLADAKKITLERTTSIENLFDYECTNLQVEPRLKVFWADTECYSPEEIKNELLTWGCEQTFVVTAYFSKKMENNNE